MNTTPTESNSNQRIEHILSMLSKYRTLWIAPAILAMVLSVIYIVALRPESWSAKQSLIVRDDLLGQSFKPGRFDSIESMKSAQETILEIARKPQVIRNALTRLGPEPDGLFSWSNSKWPSEETIEDVQGSITFTAPNGAEFGKTEVIVLNTKASNRARSRTFIDLLLEEIIIKVDEVRSLRLDSMEAELIQARDAALETLAKSKSRLKEMDENLGSDFGSMTSMSDTQSSDNQIKRDISQIRLEKRATEKDLESLKIALSQLMAAQENPQQIFATSAALIRMLPSLDDLKKALIKTQGELAVMAGQYEPAHPSYRKAKNSIEAMKQQLFLELASSIAGLKEDIKLAENRILRQDLEIEGLNDRLVRLGSRRADLMTLVAEVNQRAEIANKAQSDLSEIEALSQAMNAELITRVDEPQVSTRPDGLGKKVMVLLCGFGGLMLGLGLVMLIAPPLGQDQEQSSARTGGSSETAQRQDSDSFFDSKTFEKIIVSAATAATTAVQSAAKARQFFMPPKQEHADTFERDSVDARGNDGPKSFDATDPTPKSNAPDTPTVQDLLDAANAINTPAPVASQPLSAPPRRIKIRTAEPKTTTSKFTVHAVNPATKPGSGAPIGGVPVSESSPTATTRKPNSEMAAIQEAALQGTQDQSRETNQANSSNLHQRSNIEPAMRESEPSKSVTASPVNEAVRESSMSSELSTPASMNANVDPNAPSQEPVAQVTRRGPNVRPVDLARSAAEEDSTFVRINWSADEAKSNDQLPTETVENRSSADVNSMAVPDQIQKLADSITRFVDPANQNRRDP